MRLSKAIVVSLTLGTLHGPAYSAPVTPSFTTGTVTSHSETTTLVTERIRQIDYMTGSQYTVTGTNIAWDGPPAPGANYTLVVPGQAFQFSETYLGPGESSLTEIDRTTTSTTVTDSISVFTQ
jgi:hypothetical protein